MQPHRGGGEQAIIGVCPDHSVRAAIWDSGSLYVLAPEKGEAQLPEPMQQFIAKAKEALERFPNFFPKDVKLTVTLLPN